MFRISRISLALLAAAGLLFAPGCSSDSSSDSSSGSGKAAASAVSSPAAPAASPAGHGGTHVYACPMHPEVVSTEPGAKCPKCGMTLEHNDKAGNGKSYRMQLVSTPTQPTAGRPVTLALRPTETANASAPVPLDVVHEKKMHLIIVSKDLAQFYHKHPEYSANGDYKVPYTFAKGGDYVLFQDYTPSGAGHQLGRQLLTVKGPAYAPVTFKNDDLQWEQEGYRATLSFDKPLTTGQLLGMKITIGKGGRPVTDLANYLGALGHVVVISEDTEQYLHVHPTQQADKGPRIGFHTTFKKPGLYRVFLQFNHGGRIRTGDFTVNVKA